MSFKVLRQWEEIGQNKMTNYPFHKRKEQSFLEPSWLVEAT
jgi:hypothetical protein